MRKIEINGIKIDLDKIKNSKLRNIIIRERGFLFFGSNRRDYKEHNDTKSHTDEIKEGYGDYNEASTHTDIFASSTKSHSEHKDYTDSHIDHSEHSEYSDYKEYTEDGLKRYGDAYKYNNWDDRYSDARSR